MITTAQIGHIYFVVRIETIGNAIEQQTFEICLN